MTRKVNESTSRYIRVRHSPDRKDLGYGEIRVGPWVVEYAVVGVAYIDSVCRFRTKKEAVAEAKYLAKRHKVALVIETKGCSS